jgi:predicted DNA-binding transcriptional regulator AlpA
MADTKHHLDKRAQEILAFLEDRNSQELIDTRELAEYLGVSTQWAEIARHEGKGPKWLPLSTRQIRYRVSEVRAWLDSRVCAHTAEYTRRPSDDEGK